VLKRFKAGRTGRELIAPERKKENPYLWLAHVAHATTTPKPVFTTWQTQYKSV
jgi:hypothetical protein